MKKKDLFSKEICPFVYKSFSNDCYYCKLDSLSIDLVIYYCSKNFQECEIYKSNSFSSEDQR